MVGRSAYQPSQWTVAATGRLIYPPYIWVEERTLPLVVSKTGDSERSA